MNILFVNYGDFSSNSINHIGPFANELTRRGHFCVVAVPTIGDTIECIEERLFQPATYTDVLTTSIHFPNGKPADIVHAWTPRINVSEFIYEYLDLHGSRLMVHLEDNEEALIESYYDSSIKDLLKREADEPSFKWEKALSHPLGYKHLLNLADGYTVIIDSLREFITTSSPTILLYPGLDLNKFDAIKENPSLRKQLGISKETILLVYPGGISASNLYDVANLYNAVRLLHEKGLNIKLIKTGPNNPKLNQVIGSSLDKFVIDLGFIPKSTLLTYLKTADLLVQPGTDERFNNYRLPSKLPEFLAIGKPVITGNTNIGKILSKDHACIPLSKGTPEEIAALIEKTFRDKTLGNNTAYNGKSFAREAFDLTKNTNLLENHYHKILNQASINIRAKNRRLNLNKRIWLTKIARTSQNLLKIFSTLKLYNELSTTNVRSDIGDPPTESIPELTYSKWIEQEKDRIDEMEKSFLQLHQNFEQLPLISILLPVYKVKTIFLREAIESVIRQIYPKWELCIAEDKTNDPQIIDLLQDYAKRDKRIKVVFRNLNGDISLASNTALDAATGDYVALLDHDDVLAPHALLLIHREISGNRQPSIIYSDEDKIDESGKRYDPHFKTGWNPALLLGQNYINHFCVYSSSLLKSLNGFRKGYEGAQDWDLLLRATRITDPRDIVHIPEVLYHWRSIPQSTALSSTAKPYVRNTAKVVIQTYLAQYRPIAILKEGPFENFYIRYKVQSNLSKTLLITPPIKSLASWNAIKKALPHSATLIVLDEKSALPKLFHSSSFQQFNDPYTAKSINTFIYEHNPNQIVLLGPETIPSNRDDLQNLINHTYTIQNGIIGARILKPNGRISSVGTSLNANTIYSRLFEGLAKDDDGYFQRARLSSNLSAVSPSCMAFRYSVWKEIGGFDEQLKIEFSCIDLCLKSQTRGYFNLVDPTINFIEDTPFAERQLAANHYSESQALIRSRWKDSLMNDIYSNKNLSHYTGRYILRNQCETK